jgi:hypothetical protein
VRAAWWQEKQDEIVDSFLVEPQNQIELERCDWRGGYTESAGFVAIHHKTVGVTWLSHKTKTEGSTGGDGIRARREALKRATRSMIEVLVLGGHEGLMDARPSDEELLVLTKMPL